jgi:hypothetical protein
MTVRRWSFAVVSGCALLLLGACGSNLLGQLLTDAGQVLEDGGNAHAQVPSTCKKWLVQRMYYDTVGATANASTATSTLAGGDITIPDGWEPFGGTAFGSSTSSSQFLLLRKCIL